MKDAADKLKSMDLSEKELDDLQDQLQRLQDAKSACSKGCKGDKDGGKGDGQGDTDQPNQGGRASGRRPLGKEMATKSFDAKQKGDFDPKGKKIFDGFGKGKNFRAKSGVDLVGEIKQATQEAPEAIEQQRIPKAARDMAKGYFQNLGGQDEKDAKQPEKK